LLLFRLFIGGIFPGRPGLIGLVFRVFREHPQGVAQIISG
jgi:hypothetical protein